MKKIIALAVALVAVQAKAFTVGQYTGVCKSGSYETTQALYIAEFTNVVGEKQILPITTLQFFDTADLPKNLKHLASGDAKNLKQVAKFVRRGYSGTDNNQGFVGTGSDFAYVYRAETTADAITLKVSTVFTGDVTVAPPILTGCEYGHVDGVYAYQGCVQRNDQTVFTQNADGQLVSVRTADERVRGSNMLSFRLPAFSQTCVWTAKN